MRCRACCVQSRDFKSLEKPIKGHLVRLRPGQEPVVPGLRGPGGAMASSSVCLSRVKCPSREAGGWMKRSSQFPHPGDLCPSPELLGSTPLFCPPDISPPPPPSGFQNRLDRGRPRELRAVYRAWLSTGPSWTHWGCGQRFLPAPLRPHRSPWSAGEGVPTCACVLGGTMGTHLTGCCGVSLVMLMLGCPWQL